MNADKHSAQTIVFLRKLRYAGIRLAARVRLLARRAVHAPVVSCLVAITVTSAIFLAFPGLDLWFSGLFYDSDSGFWAARTPELVRLRALGPTFVWLIGGISALILVVRAAWPDRPPLVGLRAPVFLLTTLALGPGLLVNGILKSYSGRPRPRYVEMFGGDLPYVPVWRFTDYCADNCSFVSGEGASGLWFLALALVVPRAWRIPTALAAGLLGFAVSLNRVAFGGHFLSDSLLSWCLTGLVVLLAHRLFYRDTPRFLTDDALDRTLARFGWWLRETADHLRRRIREAIRARRS
ncbi:phosphatase PAP2 family protein [Breoghania sp. L-A4]|uniref:phosphatase PAP2 family protein n=1 Tax=Breoghania sp. L-A4 TaxID=2304600 RepID=UPI000E35E33B|nr:phosphatase PAP2 family protein [Breoghania sp. L-A4]AXS38866.1 PAP2 family protein [Breoghania sp. L-A4]